MRKRFQKLVSAALGAALAVSSAMTALMPVQAETLPRYKLGFVSVADLVTQSRAAIPPAAPTPAVTTAPVTAAAQTTTTTTVTTAPATVGIMATSTTTTTAYVQEGLGFIEVGGTMTYPVSCKAGETIRVECSVGGYFSVGTDDQYVNPNGIKYINLQIVGVKPGADVADVYAPGKHWWLPFQVDYPADPPTTMTTTKERVYEPLAPLYMNETMTYPVSCKPNETIAVSYDNGGYFTVGTDNITIENGIKYYNLQIVGVKPGTDAAVIDSPSKVWDLPFEVREGRRTTVDASLTTATTTTTTILLYDQHTIPVDLDPGYYATYIVSYRAGETTTIYAEEGRVTAQPDPKFKEYTEDGITYGCVRLETWSAGGYDTVILRSESSEWTFYVRIIEPVGTTSTASEEPPIKYGQTHPVKIDTGGHYEREFECDPGDKIVKMYAENGLVDVSIPKESEYDKNGKHYFKVCIDAGGNYGKDEVILQIGGYYYQFHVEILAPIETTLTATYDPATLLQYEKDQIMLEWWYRVEVSDSSGKPVRNMEITVEQGAAEIRYEKGNTYFSYKPTRDGELVISVLAEGTPLPGMLRVMVCAWETTTTSATDPWPEETTVTSTTGEGGNVPVKGQKPFENAGDINEDGKLNVADAVLVARAAASDTTLHVPEAGMKKADWDQSGVVDSADLVMILKFLAKKI